MKKIILLTGILTAVIVAIVSCTGNEGSPVSTALTNDSLVRRGEYLVTMMGCEDCHSPKIMGPNGVMVDPERRLSGHPSQMPTGNVDTAGMKSWIYFNHTGTAIAGPWGISFTANLTSDSTGIGMWTEEQFNMAMRKGKYKGLAANRDLLPPMPWFNYIYMKDEDMKAIFAFLKSTKPVKNVVPQPVPPTAFIKKG